MLADLKGLVHAKWSGKSHEHMRLRLAPVFFKDGSHRQLTSVPCSSAGWACCGREQHASQDQPASKFAADAILSSPT